MASGINFYSQLAICYFKLLISAVISQLLISKIQNVDMANLMARNCSRKDSDWILESMHFVIVIDNWNSLSAGCTNCNTINTFKKHLLPELELGAVKILYLRHLR